MADIISQKREKGAKKKVLEKNSFYHGLKGKGSIEKKRFLSGIAQITYPPPDPNSGNLVLFFRNSKFKIWKSV